LVLTIIIKDQLDYNFPKQLLTKGKLLFHGTGKIFADIIEKNGFQSGIKPYDIEDVKSLMRMYHLLGYGKHVEPHQSQFVPGDVYDTGFWDIENYVLKGNDSEGFEDLTSPYASFTYNYWQAGSYSGKRGGETIQSLVLTIYELKDFLEDTQKIKKHLNEVKNETKLANLGNGVSQKDIISNLEDVEFMKKTESELWDLFNKQIPNFGNYSYREMMSNHLPEIIATNIESSKLIHKTGKVDGTENDLLAEIDIPVENIVARISFNKGHNGLPWNIIKGKIGEMGGYEWAQTVNINKKIVSKYGEAIEDPSK